MRYKISILRQSSSGASPYIDERAFETDNANETVATALEKLNASSDDEIRWECSCLQKKCGACAMRINGYPRLACDTKLIEFKKGEIKLEPLKKFPVVADLIVDRGVMFDNLKKISVWLEQDAVHGEAHSEIAYEASRCLQCGCCLEVCPNFSTDGDFFSAAAIAPSSRVIAELEGRRKYEILAAYRKNLYNGCGKSLSCMNVCPAGIDVQNLLVNSNAAAIWKRFLK